MKCKLFSLILVTVLLLACAMPVCAAGELLNDEAGLLTDSQKEAVSEALSSAGADLGIQVAVATVDSLSGSAEDFYRAGGYSSDCILFLVSMETRDWYILTMGKAEDLLNSADTDAIFSQMSSSLSAGYYADAFSSYAQACDSVLNDRASRTTPAKKGMSPFWIIGSLFVGLSSGTASSGALKAELKSVKPKSTAGTYVRKNSLNLRVSQDIFLRKDLERTAKPQKQAPSASGSQSGKF